MLRHTVSDDSRIPFIYGWECVNVDANELFVIFVYHINYM